MMSYMKMIFLFVIASTALGGCSAIRPLTQQGTASLEAWAIAPVARVVAPSAIIPLLPQQAGAITAIRYAERPLGQSREIDLATEPNASPYRNRVVIASTRGEPGQPAFAWPGRPSLSGINSELAAAFPGLAMVITNVPGRNQHGVYGRAVGRRGDGLRCLYAWQWVDEIGRGSGDVVNASIRVSLCSSTTTLDVLATYVDRMVLGPAPDLPSIRTARAPERIVLAAKITRAPALKLARKAPQETFEPLSQSFADRPGPSERNLTGRYLGGASLSASPTEGARRLLGPESRASQPRGQVGNIAPSIVPLPQ